jgi:hypothetical protein
LLSYRDRWLWNGDDFEVPFTLDQFKSKYYEKSKKKYAKEIKVGLEMKTNDSSEALKKELAETRSKLDYVSSQLEKTNLEFSNLKNTLEQKEKDFQELKYSLDSKIKDADQKNKKLHAENKKLLLKCEDLEKRLNEEKSSKSRQ